MTLSSQVAAFRDVMTSSNRTRSIAMYLMHQELARAHEAQRQLEAARARRVRALVSRRRWHRQAARAQRAAQRAQLALTAV
jgi:hypothetical protein